ncbi:MAG: hypothetical protein ACI8V8_000272 [Chitinophagales bacterium]|jgi:hypothetical protein
MNPQIDSTGSKLEQLAKARYFNLKPYSDMIAKFEEQKIKEEKERI